VEGDRSLLALFQAADGQVEVFQQSCIVYPNPTKGTVVIDFAAIAFEHPETIEIINSLGEKLTNYRIAPGSSEVSLSTASFPSGTYFVLLLNNQKCLLVRKILVFK
jgi:hypothetical protein